MPRRKSSGRIAPINKIGQSSPVPDDGPREKIESSAQATDRSPRRQLLAWLARVVARALNEESASSPPASNFVARERSDLN